MPVPQIVDALKSLSTLLQKYVQVGTLSIDEEKFFVNFVVKFFFFPTASPIKERYNLLTHSDLFTTFAPTLAKDAPFGVGSPSSEASPFGGAFVIIAPLK